MLDAVVLSPLGGGLSLLSELAAARPVLPLIAVAPFRADDGEVLVTCRDAGALLLVEGLESSVVGELVARHTLGFRRRAALSDGPRALKLVEPLQLAVWDLVLREVERPLRTSHIARRLRVSREHLSRQFAAGGAPNLKRVIDLSRVSCAAQLLEHPGCSSQDVVRLLHFVSLSHLTSTARRIAGVGVPALGPMGARGVLAAFVKGGMRSR